MSELERYRKNVEEYKKRLMREIYSRMGVLEDPSSPGYRDAVQEIAMGIETETEGLETTGFDNDPFYVAAEAIKAFVEEKGDQSDDDFGWTGTLLKMVDSLTYDMEDLPDWWETN